MLITNIITKNKTRQKPLIIFNIIVITAYISTIEIATYLVITIELLV